MEDIHVYHSFKKNFLTIAISLVFTAIAIYGLINHKNNELWIWGCLLFFGGGALFIIGTILKERITGRPFLVISDESVVMNSRKAWEVRYADVEHFFLTGKLIGIYYKEDVDAEKMNTNNYLGRLVRRFNVKLTGVQEHLPASNLTISPQQLCNLLNERLKAFKEANKTS